MTNYFRVKAADALREARNLAEAGKFDEAQTGLKQFRNAIETNKYNNEAFFQNLDEDIDMALNDIMPTEYMKRGRHNLIGNTRAQYQEKFYLQSRNKYTNSMEMELFSTVASKRGKFSSKFSGP